MVIDEARTSGATVHFASLMNICHLESAEWEAKNQKYKGRVVLRGDVTDDSILHSSLNKDLQHLKLQQSKSCISSPDCQVAMDKQQTQYLFMSRKYGYTQIVKNSKIGVPDIWIRLPRHKWPKSRSSMDILWQDCCGKAIWENPIAAQLGEGFQLGMLIRTPWKRIVLICVCGWHKIGWKETQSWSDVESTSQRSRFGRTLGSCFLGMHSMTMRNKQRDCEQLHNHVRIANFIVGGGREVEKLPFPQKLRISSWSYLWHGWSCKEVCGTMLWVGEQDDSATPQSVCSMHRWPPLQRRRNEICWRIVTCMLSNCSEMFILGTNWKTWYSMVSKLARTIHNKMDQSLWQTPESIDFLCSSHEWIQTILSCGKHC